MTFRPDEMLLALCFDGPDFPSSSLISPLVLSIYTRTYKMDEEQEKRVPAPVPPFPVLPQSDVEHVASVS